LRKREGNARRNWPLLERQMKHALRKHSGMLCWDAHVCRARQDTLRMERSKTC
jgi:hypothetical protein